MDDSERLRPCFCGHMPSWRWVGLGEKRRWWIACDTCRFTGRLWPTQLEAVIAWDNRIQFAKALLRHIDKRLADGTGMAETPAPAEEPASEPCCGERCCCTPEYLARLEAANEALSVANGSLQETIYPWQEESGMVNGCGDGEGITPTDWASARNAMDGAMARLKAENAKLRSLLTRVAAIDWIDPTRMPSTLRDDIREALKGD